jgi:hypothetical protein
VGYNQWKLWLENKAYRKKKKKKKTSPPRPIAEASYTYPWSAKFTCNVNVTCIFADRQINRTDYDYFYFLWCCDPISCHGLPLRGFAIACVGHITLRTNPLGEWSARRGDGYLTAHKSQQTSMPPAEFEPTISAGERPQTHALDEWPLGLTHIHTYFDILTTLADANRISMTNTYCVYTVFRYSWWWTVDLSETCRVLYQINLRNSASHWLSLYEYIHTYTRTYVRTYIHTYIQSPAQRHRLSIVLCGVISSVTVNRNTGSFFKLIELT